MNVSIAVPADGPLFEGHFPGRPILPGIAELMLVAAAVAPQGVAADVSAIPFVRFRGLVRPADILDVNASPRGVGGVRFEVRRAGEVVANGAMSFGDPRWDDGGETAVASRTGCHALPVHELIPHRPPMLFVERIVGVAEDGATCLCRVPAACALVASGVTPAFVALEAAAQTAAVWEAVRRPKGGYAAVRVGYLVSLRDVVLHVRTIPAGADLIASVRLVANAPPLATYAVDVAVEGALALRGTIGTYLSD